MSGEIERIRTLALDPIRAAREAGERTGRPVVGAVSSWVPDPIAMAAGAIVLRLPAGIEGRRSGGRARAHFQASSCHFGRNILEMGLEGTLDFLDALLFVQTCDTQQNLSDIWKVAGPDVPVVDLYMPVNRRSAGAKDYLLAEIRRASGELGAITGRTVDGDALSEAIEVRGNVERHLSDLYEARLACSGRVDAVDHYGACVVSSCLPAEEADPLVEAMVRAVRSGEAVRRGRDVGCVLAGSVIPYPGLYGLLDMLEVTVGDDDLSLGRRLFDHRVPVVGDPFERIASSMLDRSPGAVKHDEGMDRGARLADMARQARVGHVVMPLLKYCDPWNWDVPRTRERLEREGIGTLHVEIGGEEDLTAGPVRNRVEAYFEMDALGELFDE
jgi:benzoyl-CoA reductase/2-hydroxyglutaryl-CoA dehydratase subunit BcrC/BadD/HgdB